MENQPIVNLSETTPVNSTPISQSSIPPQTKTNLIRPVLLTLLVSGVVFGFGGYYLGKNSPNSSKEKSGVQQDEMISSPSPTPIIKTFPTSISQTSPTPTIPVVNGVDLKKIKFTLPQEWDSKLNSDSLFISPKAGGGYLSIKVYDYPTNIGRREYYCQVSKVCIEGTTYFTDMNMGNISGFVANALDNSGGGVEYFGAKGNKFYIISSYNPPSPNEFEKSYKQVLSSLVF